MFIFYLFFIFLSSLQYIRVAHDSESLSVLKLLTSRWDLKAPNLVISVTGGAKSFKLHTRLKEAFSKGLIKVAASTDAWIITGWCFHCIKVLHF